MKFFLGIIFIVICIAILVSVPISWPMIIAGTLITIGKFLRS